MTTISPLDPTTEIMYPESDGKPMAETEIHRRAMTDTITSLEDFFRAQPNVYVGGNLLLYYEEGKPKASVAPDVFVTLGVAKEPPRRTYKLWEEQQPPTVVIEVTSRATRQEDLETKRPLYARLGVGEYFLFDPLDEYLHPPLQGYRLVDGEYVWLEPDAEGALVSQRLGLRLQREATRLRLSDMATGERLLHPDEVAAARRTAEERAAATEAELSHLRAEVARLRGAPTSDDRELLS